MKKLIIILLLPLLSYGQIAQDKQLHFAAGAGISLATYIIVGEITNDKTITTIASVGAAILAGTIKEVIDSKKKGNRFDNNDLLATSLGGFAVVIPLTIINKEKQKIF